MKMDEINQFSNKNKNMGGGGGISRERCFTYISMYCIENPIP